MSERKVCPKCGEPYSYLERRKRGESIYLYAVHRERGEGGKSKVKKCYIGGERYTIRPNWLPTRIIAELRRVIVALAARNEKNFTERDIAELRALVKRLGEVVNKIERVRERE